MAKKKISFKTTDGMKPRKLETAGKPFGLRLPMSMNIEPLGKKKVSLGVRCDCPVIVTDADGAKLFGPGQELSVTIFADGQGLSLSEGEIVGKAFVLDNSDCELVE